MNYIKKAVELADGYRLTDDADGIGIIVEGDKKERIGYWCSMEEPAQLVLDALAAQLVRQYYKKRPNHYPLNHEADPMTTIKDIVDSGVLEHG